MTRQFLIELPSIELHKDLFQGSAAAIRVYKQMGRWVQTEREHTQNNTGNVRINVALRCIHATIVAMEQQ